MKPAPVNLQTGPRSGFRFTKGRFLEICDFDDPDSLQRQRTLLELRNQLVGPPPMIIMVADDETYVWPFGPAQGKASRGLPWRCPRCKARVRIAPVKGNPHYLRSLLCYCMSATMARNISDPRNPEEWNQLRLAGAAEKFRFDAETSSGDS